MALEYSEADKAWAIRKVEMSGLKLVERHDSNWVFLDMEGTPFWWAVFTCQADAALAYSAYTGALQDAEERGAHTLI